MADVIGKAAISIGAETDDFAKQTEKGVSSAMKKVGGAIAAAFAATKVFDFLSDAALLAEQAATANARLETTLSNAGDAAGEWAVRQVELAESLSMTTGVHDEVIKQGQAILGTFHGLASTAGEAGGAFDRATIAAVDLSAAGFGSVEGASQMLGKALEDPIKGLTAMTRVGVTFTEEQRNMIASMVEAGDVAGAQAVILEAVEGQVGGVAEATADASAIAAVGWQNVKESVGTVLLPVIQAFATFMTDTLLPAVESFVDWIDTDLKPALENAKQWFEDSKGAIEGVATALLIILAPALVVYGIQLAVAAARTVASWAVQTAAAIAGAASQIFWLTMTGVWWIKLGVQAMLGAARSVLAWVIQKGPMLVTAALYVATFAAMIAGWVATAVAAMVNAVIMAAAWFIALGPVGWVIAAVIAVIAIFVLLWNNLDGFRQFWINLWEKIKEVFARVWQGIKDGLRAGIDYIKQKWSDLKDTLGKIVDFIVNLKDTLFQKAKDLVRGIWEGIKSMGGWIKDKLLGWAADMIPGPIAKALGIASPSKVMMQMGTEVGKGMAMGIDSSSQQVAQSAEMLGAATVGNARQGVAQSTTTNNVSVGVSMDDLAQLGTLQDFLAMLASARVDSRRGGSVVV